MRCDGKIEEERGQCQSNGLVVQYPATAACLLRRRVQHYRGVRQEELAGGAVAEEVAEEAQAAQDYRHLRREAGKSRGGEAVECHACSSRQRVIAFVGHG